MYADFTLLHVCHVLLLPLLLQTSAARWNARQALVNLSMSLALVDKLKLYKVPEYVHGGNIPASHYQRPYPDEQPAAPALKKADSLVGQTVQLALPHLQYCLAGCSAAMPHTL